MQCCVVSPFQVRLRLMDLMRMKNISSGDVEAVIKGECDLMLQGSFGSRATCMSIDVLSYSFE